MNFTNTFEALRPYFIVHTLRLKLREILSQKLDMIISFFTSFEAISYDQGDW